MKVKALMAPKDGVDAVECVVQQIVLEPECPAEEASMSTFYTKYLAGNASLSLVVTEMSTS